VYNYYEKVVHCIMAEVSFIPVESNLPPQAAAFPPHPIADERTRLAALLELEPYGIENPMLADGIEAARETGEARVAALMARAQVSAPSLGHILWPRPGFTQRRPVPELTPEPAPAVDPLDIPTGEMSPIVLKSELHGAREPDLQNISWLTKLKIAVKDARVRRQERRAVLRQDRQIYREAISQPVPEYDAFEQDVVIVALHTLIVRGRDPIRCAAAQDLLARMTMPQPGTATVESTPAPQQKSQSNMMKNIGSDLARLVIETFGHSECTIW
jgi:hypothetical protein